MKPRDRFWLVFLLALCAAGCAAQREGSSRETPIVRVVRDCAPTVVNIRTERIVDLKEHPDWGEYGTELDGFFKQSTIYGHFYP